MDYSFGESSKRRLGRCTGDVEKVMETAIKRSPVDFGLADAGDGDSLKILVDPEKEGVDEKTLLCVVAGVVASCAAERDVKCEWLGFSGSDDDLPIISLSAANDPGQRPPGPRG